MTDPQDDLGSDLASGMGMRGPMARRHALKLFAGAGLLVFAGCAGDDSSSPAPSTTATASDGTSSVSPQPAATTVSTARAVAASMSERFISFLF